MDRVQQAQGAEEEPENEVIQTRGIENLDFLLSRVGEDVSSISEAGGGVGNGGLLNRVKGVNSLLEKAIAAK